MRRAGASGRGRRTWRNSRLLRVVLCIAAVALSYKLFSWIQSSSFTEEQLQARTRAIAKDNLKERVWDFQALGKNLFFPDAPSQGLRI